MRFRAQKRFEHLYLRVGTWAADGVAATVSFEHLPFVREGENEVCVSLDTSCLLPGKYSLELLLIEMDHRGQMVKHDALRNAVAFEILIADSNRDWGYMELPMTIRTL